MVAALLFSCRTVRKKEKEMRATRHRQSHLISKARPCKELPCGSDAHRAAGCWRCGCFLDGHDGDRAGTEGLSWDVGTDPRQLGVDEKPGSHHAGFEAEREGLGYTAQNLPIWERNASVSYSELNQPMEKWWQMGLFKGFQAGDCCLHISAAPCRDVGLRWLRAASPQPSPFTPTQIRVLPRGLPLTARFKLPTFISLQSNPLQQVGLEPPAPQLYWGLCRDPAQFSPQLPRQNP